MTITYPLTLPSSPLPSQSKFTQDAVVAISESPFTYEQQVYAHQGQRFMAEITLPPMRRSRAEPWISTLAKLNGPFGTFLMGDWDGRLPRGSNLGVPQVNASAQTGNSLATKGWTPSKSGVLLQGDYIQLGSGASARMYKVLDDVTSDGSGNATLNIWPNLRTSPSNGDAILTVNTVTVFRLSTKLVWSADQVSTYGLNFTAVEAL